VFVVVMQIWSVIFSPLDKLQSQALLINFVVSNADVDASHISVLWCCVHPNESVMPWVSDHCDSIM